jgi:hypothetical protein
MALDITITATSGAAVTVVPDDVAAELTETYAALKALPVSRCATAKFPSPKAAREFVRQGLAWAAANELTFVRRAVPGNDKISDAPDTVSFRIYVPAPADSPRRASKGKASK